MVRRSLDYLLGVRVSSQSEGKGKNMQVKSQLDVVGVKKFQGNIEGVAYDSTTVFVLMELDESRDAAKGKAAAEFKFGTSAEFDRLAQMRFPFRADVELEITTTGKQTRQRLLSLSPVLASGPSASSPAAAAK